MDQQNMDKPMMAGKTCNCVHHKMGPWAIILIGVTFILTGFNILNLMWLMIIVGALLIVKGGSKLNAHMCNCCNRDK